MSIRRPKKNSRLRSTPVRKRESRLERRLRAFEHFAESLAHDLKAPGERIRDLAVLFRKEYENRLDERADRWLQLLERNGEDLVSRVNGLLDLAGVGAPPKMMEGVHPASVLREVLASRADELTARRAQVQVGIETGVVSCHVAALRQIFDNLISNALKFSGNRQDFEIRISSECNSGHLCISVADNGSGIPSAQRERVFNPFVRLNPEMSGSGVGLSIVRRLVESYGGRVWIESNRQRGCTVRFTLPLNRTMNRTIAKNRKKSGTR